MALTDKLKAVANAIRAKTGKTDTMTLDEMPTEIEGIEGGGDDTSLADALVTRTITEYSNDEMLSVGASAFRNCSALKTVILPNATKIGDSSFASCSKLTKIIIPNVQAITSGAFNGAGALDDVDFSGVETIGNTAFTWAKVKTLRFAKLKSVSGSFLNATVLTALIIEQSESVCTNGATSTFNGTPIAKGTGYVYVPSALVDSYKAATNWSTYADQFRALEDYTVDGTVTGELDESKI